MSGIFYRPVYTRLLTWMTNWFKLNRISVKALISLLETGLSNPPQVVRLTRTPFTNH